MKGTAIITGGSGFVGHYLVRHLTEAAPELKLIVLDPASPSGELGVEWMPTDITSREHVVDAVRRSKPAFIFHLASAERGQEPSTLFRVNMLGTLHVLEAASGAAPKDDPRVLCVSSSAVYGTAESGEALRETDRVRPVTLYGVSKAAAELVVLRETTVSQVHAVIARPFNVIGPGQPQGFVCADIVRRVVRAERGLDGGLVRVGPLDTRRDFVDVRDVAKALWELAQRGESGEAYNIAAGSYAIQDVVDTLARLSTSPFDVVCEGERSHGRADIREQMGDNRKITEHTAWRPRITLEESLRDMLVYERTSCC